jgi:hypothetical protein
MPGIFGFDYARLGFAYPLTWPDPIISSSAFASLPASVNPAPKMAHIASNIFYEDSCSKLAVLSQLSQLVC